jgi:hypothetical protein
MNHQRLDVPEKRARIKQEETSSEVPQMHGEGAAHHDVTRLPGIATQLIGERMRSMYASMVREPVPDDLLQLVRQLESKERTE